MPDAQKPAASPAAQLSLAGMPRPIYPQGRFVAAAQYAQVLLQMVTHLFPNKTWVELSEDQRRMLFDETANLVLRARWAVESKAFADKFALPLAGTEMAPPGTVLGEPVQQPGTPGQYL